MSEIHGRDLDLNLLRVFVTVAESGSVTTAASRLYLTQSAVSAALGRLQSTMGAPVFARKGRGLVLTARGETLLATAKPHLDALVRAALDPVEFDPATSERVIRIGLSDAYETTLLPKLLRLLGRLAPKMRIIVVPVTFRTIPTLIDSLDLAIVVADELPASVHRKTIFRGIFQCLYDPRFVSLGRKPTLARYLAQEHVIVSYNGDLRGVIEDMFGVERNVRVSVPSFLGIASIVEGSALVATVPELVARYVMSKAKRLRSAALPFDMKSGGADLMWRSAVADDPAVTFVRAQIEKLAAEG